MFKTPISICHYYDSKSPGDFAFREYQRIILPQIADFLDHYFADRVDKEKPNILWIKRLSWLVCESNLASQLSDDIISHVRNAVGARTHSSRHNLRRIDAELQKVKEMRANVPDITSAFVQLSDCLKREFCLPKTYIRSKILETLERHEMALKESAAGITARNFVKMQLSFR